MAYKKFFLFFLIAASVFLFTKPIITFAATKSCKVLLNPYRETKPTAKFIKNLKAQVTKIFQDTNIPVRTQKLMLTECEKIIKKQEAWFRKISDPCSNDTNIYPMLDIVLQQKTPEEIKGFITQLEIEKKSIDLKKTEQIDKCASKISFYKNKLNPDNKGDKGPCADKDNFPDEITSELNKETLDNFIKLAQRQVKKIDPRVETQKEGKTSFDNDPEKLAQQDICYQRIDLYQKWKKKIETCIASVNELEESHTEFSKSCKAFAGGNLKCAEAINDCDKCPDAENYGDYNCVNVHKQTKCPALSGKELEEAKEKRKELDESIASLKSEIEEQEKDLISEEQNINDTIAEIEKNFKTITRELENKTIDEKALLDENLAKGNLTIDEKMSEQLAKIQAEKDNALKVAHSFENEVYNAHKEYRKERRQITIACETQAESLLRKFQERRRAAIETGSLSYSLSAYLQRGRMSFAQQDFIMFDEYNKACLTRRKADFKDVETGYLQRLRRIDQEKEQYIAYINRLNKQLGSLNQNADKAETELLNNYAKQMKSILLQHNKDHSHAMEDYNKQKAEMFVQMKNINLLERQLKRKFHSLKSKHGTMLREQEFIDYLKSRGAPSEDESEDIKNEFWEAWDHFRDMKLKSGKADTSCDCDLRKNNAETNENSETNNNEEKTNINQGKCTETGAIAKAIEIVDSTHSGDGSSTDHHGRR